MRVLLVIPCYNEAGNLPRLFEEIKILKEKVDVVVIDDGSEDDTFIVASAHFPCLRLVSNLGIGGAIQAGIKYAYYNGYDLCIQVDGDGQHPPDQIPILLEEYRKAPANLIIGSRFLLADNFKSTAMRRMGIRVIRFFIKLLYGIDVNDPTSGFRLMDREAIKHFSKEYPCDFPEPISLAFAANHGLKVKEAPVAMRKREAGATSINTVKSIFYMIRVVGYLTVLSLRRYT